MSPKSSSPRIQQLPSAIHEREEMAESFRKILRGLGENPDREGLKETPHRWVEAMAEMMTPPQFEMTTFDAEGMDEMIIQSQIPFYSLCEHHVLPFFGEGSIAYIPNGKIVGLSKLARTLEFFSRRLQNQERITRQVAEFIQENLQPLGVAVQLKARHMCMELRGVRKHDTVTTTNCLLGCFRESATRAEFFSALRDQKQ